MRSTTRVATGLDLLKSHTRTTHVCVLFTPNTRTHTHTCTHTTTTTTTGILPVLLSTAKLAGDDDPVRQENRTQTTTFKWLFQIKVPGSVLFVWPRHAVHKKFRSQSRSSGQDTHSLPTLSICIVIYKAKYLSPSGGASLAASTTRTYLYTQRRITTHGERRSRAHA